MTDSISQNMRYTVGGAYRWNVLAAGTAAQAATSAYFQGLPTIGPFLRDHYTLSLSGLGLLLAAPTAGLVLTLLLWGKASDRYGDRAVMTIGLFGAAASLAAAATVTPASATATAALLVVAGASGASVNAASGRAVLAWFRPNQRGIAMGVRQTASPVGGIIAALALPLIVAGASVKGALLLLAGGCLAAAIGVWTCVSEPQAAFPSRPAIGAPAPAPAASHPPHSVLRDRDLWRLAAASTLLVVPQFAVVAFTVALLHEHRHVSPATAALVLAILQGAGAAGRLLVGLWSDRVGSRVAPLRTLAAAMAVGALILAASVSGPLPVLVLALIIEGALVICWNGLAYTAAGELAAVSQRGTALGFQNTGNFLAASATPPVAGLTLENIGYAPAVSLLAVPAAAAALLLRRDLPQRS